MIVLDTDILAIHHLFQKDPRHEINSRFMESTRSIPRGTTLYNLLELGGILAASGKQEAGRKIIEKYIASRDMEILYPLLYPHSPEIFYADYMSELLDIMDRGLRYGDAKILWVAEAHESEAVLTWNARHYLKKTPLMVMTPEEYLAEHAE